MRGTVRGSVRISLSNLWVFQLVNGLLVQISEVWVLERLFGLHRCKDTRDGECPWIYPSTLILPCLPRSARFGGTYRALCLYDASRAKTCSTYRNAAHRVVLQHLLHQVYALCPHRLKDPAQVLCLPLGPLMPGVGNNARNS